MNLTEQIQREGNLLRRPEPSGPKPKRPLKRTQRVRRQSAKRQREGRIYTQKRKAFLERNQTCMLGGPLYSAGVDPKCTIATSQVHHVRRRLNGGFLDETSWAATCPNCHHYVETHAKLARELGLIAG